MSLKPWVAWLVDRAPKCEGCGWREGHRPDCLVLDRLVDLADRSEASLLRQLVAEVRTGRMTGDEAMAALELRRRSR